MSTERPGSPWPDQTYNGFADAPAQAVADPEPRRLPRKWLLGGVVAALAGGALLGALAMPDLDTAPPMRPEPAPPPPTSIMPIQMAPVTPPAPTPSAGPLEVLPPDMAQAAARNRPVATPRPAPPPPVSASTGDTPDAGVEADEPPPDDAPDDPGI